MYVIQELVQQRDAKLNFRVVWQSTTLTNYGQAYGAVQHLRLIYGKLQRNVVFKLFELREDGTLHEIRVNGDGDEDSEQAR